jgi:hypothetical protein
MDETNEQELEITVENIGDYLEFLDAFTDEVNLTRVEEETWYDNQCRLCG